MTKILFFIPQLVGGGAERVAMNIMELLDDSLFEVHLIVTSMEGCVYEKFPKNILIHNLGASKTIFAIFKLRNFILSLNPDIVYSSLIRGNIAIFLSLMGIKERPYLVFRSPNSPKLLIENNQMSRIEKHLLERAYSKADRIIAQTPEMKEELHRYHRIELNKIDVILNPINTMNIDNKIKDIKNPFDSNQINVVAAGRLTYQKGFDVLIKSFKKVVDKNPLYRLYIIGQNEGDELSKLQNIINELDIESYIEFVGYTTNPYRYFYFSDMYVLSSRWEGLPNTVLENLYLKTPIIATRCIPFMNELIEDNKNGILVDVEDIDGLSKAILNYNQISRDYSNIDDSKSIINKYFLELGER